MRHKPVKSPLEKKDMKVTLRSIDELVPYAKNPRTHSEDQIDAIAKSLTEFGWTNPVLVDGKGGIIAGHGRVMAARKLGMTEVPTIELSGLTAAQRRAYLIADNQTALRAGWDLPLLASELLELQAEGFSLEPLGFDAIELGRILAQGGTGGLTDPDAVPETPKDPVALPGDLWALGRHRLICGDAGDQSVHDSVIGQSKIDLVACDPPYGVGVKYAEFCDSEKKTKDLIERFMPLVLRWPRALITSGQRMMWSYPKPKWFLVWIHPAANAGGPWGFNCCNPILAYGNDPYLANRLGRRADYVVMAADRNGEGYGHPVAKPMEVWKWVIERGSVHRGDAVLDPFIGSGTTIIACEILGRNAYGIELTPAYIDVAIIRWQDFTGQSATLDGRTFEQVAADRRQTAAAA